MKRDPGPIRLHRFEDPRQRRIYDRLFRLVGPGLADFYRDACGLAAASQPVPTTSHLVGHLVREIESGLRKVLDTAADGAASTASGDGPSSPSGGGHKRNIAAILRGLGINEDGELARTWFRFAEEGLHRWAHRADLSGPRPVDDAFRRWWADVQNVFDAVLAKFEEMFVDVFRLLDELVAKETPTKADAVMFTNRVPATSVIYGHFFGRLATPAWLRLLKDTSVFLHPPEPYLDEDGAVRLQPWPQGKYLVKMANQEPDLVCEIIDAIDTNNFYAACAFIDAALAMPAPLAARIARKAGPWLRLYYGWLLPDKLGRLVAHLASGGEVDDAFTIAAQLLEVQNEQRPAVREQQDDESFRLPREPKPRIIDHLFEEILHRDLPALVAAAPERTVTLLCQPLAEAVRCSLLEAPEDASRDYSEIWRTSIAHPLGHQYRDVKNLLVSAIANAVKLAAEAEASGVPHMVRLLESFRWQIFRRLALYLLRTFPDTGRDLAVERLTDRDLLAQAAHYPEYDELAEVCFPSLTGEEQQAILDLIEAGPRVRNDWFENVQKRADYIDCWKRNRVALYSDALPTEWRSRLDEWVKRLGPPVGHDLADRLSTTERTSPKDRDELAAMDVDDIATFLKTWEPPKGFEEPTPWGLRGTLEDVVGADADRFAEAAERFVGIDATYVSGLISGFRKAVGAGTHFDWEAVLKFCKWAVNQPREIPGRDAETARFGDLAPDWGWARQWIAMLLESGFRNSEAQIPISLRDLAWEVLEPLAADPHPSAEEEQRDGSNLDPMTSSINTVRGCAMHAVIGYGLWVRRHLDHAEAGDDASVAGFDALPEVRGTLEEHLDVQADPSVTIRAVYGRYLSALAYLDGGWLRASLDQIFPPQADLRALRDAAWQTYLVYGDWGKSTFLIAHREYERAVDELRPDDAASDGMRDPAAKLAEHLMTLYWWGEITLDNSDSIMPRFFDRGSPVHRARAISFVGHSLRNHDGPLSPEIRQRLEALWAFRLTAAQAASSAEVHAGEMAAFGWWFISGKFDDRWALEQLQAALAVHPKTDLNHEVVVRLADWSEESPAEAITCARRMCVGDEEGWDIPTWKESLRRILVNALNSGNGLVLEARALISYLASRGFIDFRDMAGGAGEQSDATTSPVAS